VWTCRITGSNRGPQNARKGIKLPEYLREKEPHKTHKRTTYMYTLYEYPVRGNTSADPRWLMQPKHASD
jgi:hypothetical protein